MQLHRKHDDADRVRRAEHLQTSGSEAKAPGDLAVSQSTQLSSPSQTPYPLTKIAASRFTPTPHSWDT